jgi:hypothetical protein
VTMPHASGGYRDGVFGEVLEVSNLSVFHIPITRVCLAPNGYASEAGSEKQDRAERVSFGSSPF